MFVIPFSNGSAEATMGSKPAIGRLALKLSDISFCSVFQHSKKLTSMHARPCMWHLRLIRSTGADAYQSHSRLERDQQSGRTARRLPGPNC
jgi:hypothetical protein